MPQPEQDHYRTLQVWRDAGPAVIDAARERLLAAAGEDQAQREQIEEAYAVLRDPQRRAAHDRELDAAAAPAEPTDVGAATEEPAAAEPAASPPGGPPRRETNTTLLAALIGLVVVGILLAGGLLAFALTRDDGSDYGDRGDDDYNLEAMQLRNGDLPGGMSLVRSQPAANQDWALQLAPEGSDPAPVLSQLEAVGRVRGHQSIYAWDDPSKHPGESWYVTSLSTVYADENAAEKSMTGVGYCGIVIDPNDASNQVREFPVSGLGQDAIGYEIASQSIELVPQTGIYSRLVETVVCFRTGRLLHVVSQMSLSGGENLGLAYQLAKNMESRVDDEYAGRAEPVEVPTEIG